MAKLGDLIVNIGANTKDLNKKLGQVRRSMRQMSSNFEAVGKSMTRSLTLPLTLVGGAAIKLGMDFESAMAQVKAVSGATGNEFKKLEQSAKDLGASTIFTASEVAGLQLEFSRLGFSANEIVKVQEATLNLAQATGSDLAQAAEVAGATLRAFGMDASETGRVTDVMAASFSSSALSIDTFQDSMKYVAPDAKAAGVSIEETSAMLAVLANSGIKGSQAGTALRRILQEMTGTSGTLTERFNELAAQGIGVKDAMDEVGRRAGSSLLVLSQGASQVNDLTRAFRDSKGAAKDMADIMNDTAQGALKEMISALQGVGITIGDMLMPMFVGVLDAVKDLAEWFSGLSNVTKKIIISMGVFVATLGPLLIIIPKLISGFIAVRAAVIAFNISLMSNPITLAAVAIAGITAAVVGYNLASQEAVYNTDNFAKSLEVLTLKQQKQQAEFAIKSFDAGPMKAHLDELESLEEEYNAKRRISLGEEGGFANRQEKENMRNRINVLKQMTKEFAVEYKKMQIELRKINEEIAADERKAQKEREARAVNSIENLRKNVTDTKKALEAAVIGSDEYTQALQDWKSATIELAEATEIYNKKNEETKESLPIGSLGALKEQLNDLRSELDDLVPGTQAFIDKMAEIDAVAEQVENATARMDSSLEKTSEGLENFATTIEDSLSAGAASMLSNIGQMIGGAQMGAQGILAPLADMAIRLGELAIGYGVAVKGIKEALKSLNAAAAIMAGIALVALGTALRGAMSSIAEGEHNMPELHSGGLAFGPTTALVGDNKNARIDPEVIAPLSKLRDMLGGGSTNVYGRISGDDIVISNDRATRDRNRYG
tara:strand:+ start:529 stop:3024 length:2496 start_codon:yes stop_codon:yes gene_type:complete